MPGICYAFQKGECERGDACRFSHNEAEADSSTLPKPRGICYAFNKGECDRGESCRFLHEAGDVPEGAGEPMERRPRERKPKSSTSAGRSSTSAAKSSGACFAFQRGECDRGDSCRFSHTEGGEAAEPRAPKPRGACFDFQKGACERGDSCRFSHESVEA